MARRPPRPIDPDTIAHLRSLATLMDSKFRVPGTGLRFGLDGVLGLVPGIGDTVSGAVSAYIIYQAHRIGVPKSTLTRMLANAGLDWAVGSIPILGEVFDFAFKANNRNMALLNQHLDEYERTQVDRLPPLRDMGRRTR